MATHHAKLPSRAIRGLKDENATSRIGRKQSTNGPFRPVVRAKTMGADRTALGEVKKVDENLKTKKEDTKDSKPIFKGQGSLKRVRSASLATATAPQRVPLGPGRVAPVTTTTTVETTLNVVPKPVRKISVFTSQPAPAVPAPAATVTAVEADLDIKMDDVDENVPIVPRSSDFEIVDHYFEGQQPAEDLLSSEVDGPVTEDEDEEHQEPRLWPDMHTQQRIRCRLEVDAIRESFEDPVDVEDITMVSEYAQEIFDYMEELEEDMMPNPDYMSKQTDLSWSMRQTLVDWLLQVHIRYHLLPETLWIAINVIDRFLSKRVVSHQKLQLVGVTALFIAAKYEEILAPSIDEFVFMTGNGYSKSEIMKGERILLQTIEFKVSHYCSPYSWMRRISKADDYDIQTRTLSKFLTEVTLLDWRFLRAKPSLVAAVGMYTARMMLGQDWDDAFVFHSGFTERELVDGHKMLVEKLCENGFEKLYVCKKYAQKKFLKASIFAVEWAQMHLVGSVKEMAFEE